MVGNTGQADAMRNNDLREGRDPDAGFDAQTHFLHDCRLKSLRC